MIIPTSASAEVHPDTSVSAICIKTIEAKPDGRVPKRIGMN
jgi:hypothetical protein